MARKKVFIDIQLSGENTIAGLEQDLKAINQELKNVEVGTDAFKQLEAQSLKVRSELKSIKNDLKPITDNEQRAALKSLGDGLAGAFQIGGAAAVLFGDQTNEQFQKVAKAVGGVIVAVNGFNKLLTLTSRGNILRLKSLAAQWGLVGNSATIAGVKMRTALIATGIGAFLVALGAVVANWDKITKFITNRKADKALDKQVENLEKQAEALQALQGLYGQQATIQQELNEIRNNAQENIQVEIDLREKEQNLLETQINLLENQLLQAEKEINKELEKGITLRDFLEGTIRAMGFELDTQTDARIQQYQELVRQKQILEETKKTDELRVELLKEQLNLLEETKDIDLDAQRDIIAALERQQTILDANNNSYEKKHKNNVDILRAKQEQIRMEAQLAGFLSREQDRQLKELDAQIQALNIREDIRLRELKTNLQLIKLEIERNRTYERFNVQLLRAEKSVRRFQAIERDRQDLLINNQKLVEVDLRGLENARQIQDDLINFDRRRNDILERRTKELIPSEVRITKEAYREIENFLKVYSEQFEYADIEYFGKALKEGIVRELEDGTIEQVFTGILNYRKILLEGMAEDTGVLKTFEELNEYEKQAINRAAENLALREIEADFYIKSLTAQRDAIAEQLNLQADIIMSYEEIVEQIKKEAGELDSLLEIQTQIANAEEKRIELGEERTLTDAELYEIQQDILFLETQRYGITQQLNNSVSDLEQKYENCNDLQKDILDVEFDLAQAKTSVNVLQEDSVDNLIEQLRLSAQLNYQAEKYSQEIQATQDILYETLGLTAAIFDRIAAKRSEDLQKWKDENKTAIEEIAETEKTLGNRRRELNDLLADAEGERYEMILAELNNINEQEALNAEQQRMFKNREMEMQYEIDKAEYEAAKFRKMQTMVDIALATALAVVRALPNLLLSGLVGGIGGLQFGIAAAQKLPPKPPEPQYMALGGWVSGDSHARPSQGVPVMMEDEEYVVNKYAAKQYGGLLETLNSSVRPKMAKGGSPSQINTTSDIDLFDYQKLAGTMVQALKENPMFVSVREFKDVERRIKVVESRTSIGKNK